MEKTYSDTRVKTTSAPQERLVFIDYIRVVACFMVMMNEGLLR